MWGESAYHVSRSQSSVVPLVGTCCGRERPSIGKTAQGSWREGCTHWGGAGSPCGERSVAGSGGGAGTEWMAGVGTPRTRKEALGGMIGGTEWMAWGGGGGLWRAPRTRKEAWAQVCRVQVASHPTWLWVQEEHRHWGAGMPVANLEAVVGEGRKVGGVAHLYF